LLVRLEDFYHPVLVAGCQRSGTTAVARLLNRADGMVDYRFGKDDELDAALILSGGVEHQPQPGRYCFQTTYLNESYAEYFERRGHYQLIWVVREPQAVVYSMVHNWKRFALNELFDACGKDLLDDAVAARYRRWKGLSVGAFERACLSYNAKVSQLFHLARELSAEELMVVDYNDVVGRKEEIVPVLFRFAGLPYRPVLTDGLHSRSLKTRQISVRQQALIDTWCSPVYERARALLTDINGTGGEANERGSPSPAVAGET
jgi:hypothetical protein